jgi:hypothetical protein
VERAESFCSISSQWGQAFLAAIPAVAANVQADVHIAEQLAFATLHADPSLRSDLSSGTVSSGSLSSFDALGTRAWDTLSTSAPGSNSGSFGSTSTTASESSEDGHAVPQLVNPALPPSLTSNLTAAVFGHPLFDAFDDLSTNSPSNRESPSRPLSRPTPDDSSVGHGTGSTAGATNNDGGGIAGPAASIAAGNLANAAPSASGGFSGVSTAPRSAAVEPPPPPNQPPVAGNDNFGTLHDQSITASAPGVMSNDFDGDGDPITATLVSGTSNGALTFNSDGSFAYTPNAGYVGSDTFTYKVSDGLANSNPATVSIGVVNSVPSAGPDNFGTLHDQSITASAPGVMSNDFDGDGDPITATLTTGTSSGALTFNSDGSFVYAPNAGYVGSDSFTYTSSDGIAQSDPATVTIVVINNAPSAADDFFSFDPDDPSTVTIPVLDNDFDPDPNDNPLHIVGILSPPTQGSVSFDDQHLYYTPPAEIQWTNENQPDWMDGHYSDEIAYQIKDNAGALAFAQAKVQVTKTAEWALPKLRNDFDEAKEIKIDGTFGYVLKYNQIFGKNVPGLTIPAKTQRWQTNAQMRIMMFVDKNGALSAKPPINRTLIDINDISGKVTPLTIGDTLGTDENPDNANIKDALFCMEITIKKAGFSPAGQGTLALKGPNGEVPYEPDAATVEKLMTMKGPFLEAKTGYLFVNKKLLLELLAKDIVTPGQIDTIKQLLAAPPIKLQWDSLPDVKEGYTHVPLGQWEYPSP